MKTPIFTAVALLSAVIAQSADAAWQWSPSRPSYDPYHDRRYDERYDERRWREPRRYSLEARAQVRLRQLGYYRGPIDGSFGPGSRRALARFQRDRGLRMTGYLDRYTIRALRI